MLSGRVVDDFIEYVDERWHVVVCVAGGLAVDVRLVRVVVVTKRIVWRVGVVAEEVLRSGE